MDISEFTITLMHAFTGWALCEATLLVGSSVTSYDNALIFYAIAAPIFFVGVSLVYFRKFNDTSPVQTAAIFSAYVLIMDLFVVALLIDHSLRLFSNLLGTWIPIGLIFLSTWLVGRLVTRSKKENYTA
jgi:peptidoglycan/LPS O-acetylase OafA/YrhL